MKFSKTLVKGKLIKRYKRFLTDVELENGEIVVAHCTNSGTMKTCIEEGAPVYLTPVDDPKRKTKFTWEMIYMNNDWIGINTSHPNLLAFDAIKNNEINRLKGYSEVKREVKWEDSRFDVMAKTDNEICFVEVKNATMKSGEYAIFPDAVTTRGRKHLETLIRVKKAGMRAVMLYVIQRSDVDFFDTANEIDPDYGKTLRKAVNAGVEIIAMQAKVTPEEIKFVRELKVNLR